MKQLVLSLFISVFMSLSLSAQTDISVQDIGASSDINNWVPLDLRSSLEVRFKNEGSALPMGDSVLVSVQYGSTIFESWVMLASSLATGAEYTHNFGANNRLKFTQALDTALLMAQATHLADTNALNNTYTETFYASSIVNNDWNAGPIDIISPSNIDQFDIDNGTNIPPPLSEIEVELFNNGTVTYLEGTSVDYRIYIGSNESTLSGTINDGSVGNGESTIRNISNQAVLPALPDTAGTFQLCAATEVPNDLTPGNNAACLIFQIVDNYDPNDPANWPFGINENALKESQVYLVNNNLMIKSEATAYTIGLFDLSGKQIMMSSHDHNAELDLSEYNAGVYFVRLEKEGTEPVTKKIVLL